MLVSRNDFVCLYHVGEKVTISNGKKFDELVVTQLMVGHKFGCYCFTKVLGGGIHVKSKKKKKKK